MVRKKTDPTLEPDEGLSEDERVAKAIFAACEGFGEALWITIQMAVQDDAVPSLQRSTVIEAWKMVGAKLLAVMMEGE